MKQYAWTNAVNYIKNVKIEAIHLYTKLLKMSALAERKYP